MEPHDILKTNTNADISVLDPEITELTKYISYTLMSSIIIDQAKTS